MAPSSELLGITLEFACLGLRPHLRDLAAACGAPGHPPFLKHCLPVVPTCCLPASRPSVQSLCWLVTVHIPIISPSSCGGLGTRAHPSFLCLRSLLGDSTPPHGLGSFCADNSQVPVAGPASLIPWLTLGLSARTRLLTPRNERVFPRAIFPWPTILRDFPPATLFSSPPPSAASLSTHVPQALTQFLKAISLPAIPPSWPGLRHTRRNSELECRFSRWKGVHLEGGRSPSYCVCQPVQIVGLINCVAVPILVIVYS